MFSFLPCQPKWSQLGAVLAHTAECNRGQRRGYLFGLFSWLVVATHVTLHTSVTKNFTDKAPRDSKYSANYLIWNNMLPQLFSCYVTHFI